MTPPRMNPSQQPINRASMHNMNRSAQADHPCDMTFDEVRELPMRMQLGLDLSALD